MVKKKSKLRSKEKETKEVEETQKAKTKEEESAESSDDDSSDESDVGVALEGAIDEHDSSSSDEDEVKSKKRKKKNKKRSKKKEEIHVEFIFCDMDEKFFDGIKCLVASSPIHAAHSSTLTDLIVDNVEVGTVVSTEGYEEDYVYGYASILSMHNDNQIINSLKETFLPSCPENHKAEMQLLLTGDKKARRLVGLFLHERMLNVPLVITHAIHQQLLLDLEWAVKNNPLFDFGLLVRIAPCYPQTTPPSNTPAYKYFDDDVFSSNAEFFYTLPKSYSDDNLLYCVIVLSVTAYKKSIEELANLNTV